jgi:glycerol uptake facilitator-like aquaporin
MAKTKPKQSAAIFGTELMPGALSAELIGTFILTAAVLVTSGNVLVVAITVMVLVLTFGAISGAHVNPIMTISLFATKQIGWVKALGYVVAQVLGAMLALIVINQFLTSNTDAAAAGIKAYEVRPLTGTWVPALAEAIGGLIFGLGVAATVMGKKQGYDAAFTIGGALLVGIVISTLGSAGVVNPAVALGVSAYTSANWWTTGVYAIAPVVGGIAGAWLYKLMQWDVVNMGKKK